MAQTRQSQGVSFLSDGKGTSVPRDILDFFDDNTRAENLRVLTNNTKAFRKEVASFEASRITIESFGRAAQLAFKRYGAFVVGSAGIFQIINFFRTATSAALEFESQITKIQQVLDVTGNQISGLTAKIRELSVQNWCGDC